jgi:hypothetical protein
MNIKLIASFAVLGAFIVSSAHASPVYKATGKDGKVTYSSKPPTKNAKPAELPEIMRGEVKLVEQKLVSCDKHGGPNCQAGPDADGSVICLDGFKNASARFRFTCNSPKLEISDVSEVAADGSFTVFVRNTKSVAAQKPVIMYHSLNGKEHKIPGPEVVEGFGVAEFQFHTKEKLKVAMNKPTLAELDITCANCP